MSYWTHLTGIIKIRVYSEASIDDLEKRVDKQMEKSRVPFGSEGKIEHFVSAKLDREGSPDYLFVVLSANLRDVSYKHDMAPDTTSTFMDIERWIKALPNTLKTVGSIDTLLVRVSDDQVCRVFYNLVHPDLLEPDIVIEQQLPHPRALMEIKYR